jgi:hypothetical protein
MKYLNVLQIRIDWLPTLALGFDFLETLEFVLLGQPSQACEVDPLKTVMGLILLKREDGA